VGGGIRMMRIYILGKALYESPKILLRGQRLRIKLEDEYLKASDFMIHLLIIILYIGISFFSAVVLCNYGYTFSDALVESVSAITTTGDSPKTLTPSLPWTPKILLGILMLLGRIEIIPLLIALSPIKERPKS
jgi:Trk-type K+ transport system membrane component